MRFMKEKKAEADYLFREAAVLDESALEKEYPQMREAYQRADTIHNEDGMGKMNVGENAAPLYREGGDKGYPCLTGLLRLTIRCCHCLHISSRQVSGDTPR